jgi:hypothetical protein
MYVDPGARREDAEPTTGLERIFTTISVFRDADGASGYLRDSLAEHEKEFVGALDVALGDESIGYRTEKSTRAGFRRGRLLASVGINRFDDADVREEAKALAVKLDARVGDVLEGTLRGWKGGPEAEVRPEQLEASTLDLPLFGPLATGLAPEMYLSGFMDNEEVARFHAIDATDDRADSQRFGRVTGHAEVFCACASGRPSASLLGSSVHLFASEQDAAAWLDDQLTDEQALAGRGHKDVTVGEVSDFPVAGVGDKAWGVQRRTSAGLRTIVAFSTGRFGAEVMIERATEDSVAELTIELARKLQASVEAATRPG